MRQDPSASSTSVAAGATKQAQVGDAPSQASASVVIREEMVWPKYSCSFAGRDGGTIHEEPESGGHTHLETNGLPRIER